MHVSSPRKPIEIRFGPRLITCLADRSVFVIINACDSNAKLSTLQLHPGLSMSLIHPSLSPLSHSCFFFSSSNTAHSSMLGDTRSSKTSKVGANPLVWLFHPPTLFFSAHSLLSYSQEGLWEYTASCIRSLIRESFATLSARCILSNPACIYHQRNDPFLHSTGRSAGVDRWNIVYAFHMCSSTVIVQLCFLYWLMFLFLSYGLFARQYIVFDVCIFKKRWLHLCIVGAFVRFSWLDLSVCRHFLGQGFSCSAPGHDDPLPSNLERILHKNGRIIIFYENKQMQLRLRRICSIIGKLHIHRKLPED